MLNQTIGDCLTWRGNLTPERPAATYETAGYTWRQMDEISDYLAVWFLHRGIKKGSHVGIWGVNSLSWLVHFFALEKIGAIPVLLNICYQQTELQDVLAYADVEILCRGIRCKKRDYAAVVDQLDYSKLPKLREIIEMEAPQQSPWLQNEDVLKLSDEDQALLQKARALVTPQDVACIMFTSGTTARAKGVMLTHINLINNALAHSSAMHWTEQDKLCVCVPMFHCFGITASVLAAMHCGAALQLVKYYSSHEVLRTIEKYRCTVLSGVPSMFLALLHNKDFENHDLSSLKSGIIAGSAVSVADYHFICEKLDIDKLQPAYGQTESSPCIAMAQWEDDISHKAGSVGRAIPNVELCIWDNQKNMPITEPRRSGEIRARGYNIMKGYYKLPEVTAQTITEDGWLRTGDMGYLDEDGYLFITDRIKEIIIRGGENISPAEVEQCIATLDEVQEVHVIGLPVEVMQEQVVACIHCKPEAKLSPEVVRQYAGERLADYKVPQEVVFMDEFPLTGSGKVDRHALKAAAQRLVIQQKNGR